MNVLIFNWRDLGHPKSGGAEVATDRLAQGLVARRHRVTWFTSAHRGARRIERRSGYVIVRYGSEVTCRLYAAWWLWKHRHGFDVIIDEVNTLPFLSRLIAKDRVVLWMHQLAREVWMAEAPPLVGCLGYAMERAFLQVYRNAPVVTISRSSADSFRKYGLKGSIDVCEIALQPGVEKGEPFRGRVGYVGRLAPSKRIDHVIKALAIVRKSLDTGELVIVGTGARSEIERLKAVAKRWGVADIVTFTGKVSTVERDHWMKSIDVLAMASIREGWGLVVSEAARYHVPSVVYPVAGLVDSVINGRTGIVAESQTPRALAGGIVELIVNRALRDTLGRSASEYLAEFTEERFLGNFERVLQSIAERSAPGE